MPKGIQPLHLARTLDRQFHLWEIRRTLAREGGEKARRELAHLAVGPWVTISKQLGSGGVELAALVAERLGWQVFDREIVEETAGQTEARQAILSRLDDRGVNWLQETMAKLLIRGDPGQGGFLQEMMRVIGAVAQQGKAVLVGRGANWFLEPRYGLRVRAVAPADFRARRIVEAEKIDEAAARERLREDDAAKAGFIRQVFHRDIDDPLGYDLVLNLGAIEHRVAAGIVETALRHKLLAQG